MFKIYFKPDKLSTDEYCVVLSQITIEISYCELDGAYLHHILLPDQSRIFEKDGNEEKH